jgi:hypothetical protein
MSVSEARLIANRQNAAKSTGPKSLEGKERSRQNSCKHGLSGSGVVVAPEELDEVDRRTDEIQGELKPKSPIGMILVRQMALLSVRMERSARQETAALATRVRHACEQFDEERIAEANRLFESLTENYLTSLRRLRNMPEGVDRLLGAWRRLRDDLTREPKPVWNDGQIETLMTLCGIREADVRNSRIGALAMAVWGHFDWLSPTDGGSLDPSARKLWAKEQLLERIKAEIDELEAHRETLDFETIELDRIEAPDRALFDPSREATLARRYEAQASRGFYKALNEFRQVEAEATERAESATPAETAEPLASFRAESRSAPRDPSTVFPPPLPDRSETFRGSEIIGSNLDRAVLVPG